MDAGSIPASSTVPPQRLNDMKAITKRQQMVLDVIRQSLRDRGVPPTLREMMANLSIRSTNGVMDHLKALERKGFVALDTCRARGIKLLNEPEGPTTAGFSGLRTDDVRVPVLGRIMPGTPVLEQLPLVDTVVMQCKTLCNRSDVFGFRVSGAAMIEAGILHGDYVLVTPKPSIATGKMVLVTFGEEAVVRYYFPERTFVRFQTANKIMGPTYVRREDFKPTMLLGQVVGVFRRELAPRVEAIAEKEPDTDPGMLAAQ